MGDLKPNEPVEGKDKPEGDQNPKETPPGTDKGSEDGVDNKEFEDYKKVVKTTGFKQFSESAKEAHRLKDDEKTWKEEKEDLKTELAGFKTADETPLDEAELAKKYPDWDELSEGEKARIKTLESLKIRQAQTERDVKRDKADRIKLDEKGKFTAEVKEVMANPEYVEQLKGKEAEFKEFCYKDENLGTSVATLIKSFLFDSVKAKAEEKKPGEGLELPSGGDKPEPSKEGYTLTEVDEMIKNDPEKHKRLTEAGQLKIIDEE